MTALAAETLDSVSSLPLQVEGAIDELLGLIGSPGTDNDTTHRPEVSPPIESEPVSQGEMLQASLALDAPDMAKALMPSGEHFME